MPTKPSKSSHVDIDANQKQRIALVFPGQGSQSVGMLAELAPVYPVVEQTFAQASEALGFDLWQICQDEEKLAMTQYTQPALLTASMAIWYILREQTQIQPMFLAGHSLGEYSALCAAEALSLADAVTLVHKRGQFMQQAVAGIETKMAAVLGLDDNQVAVVCEQVMSSNDDALVSAANFNSPGQVVVAGNRIGVDVLIEQIQCMGKKVVPLKVSVPSHCALMQPAKEALQQALAEVEFNTPNIPVVQNRDATIHKTKQDIKNALIEQITDPVQWRQTMHFLAQRHVNLLIECGAGNVLSNLSKRQDPPIPSYPTDKLARLDKIMEVLV
ncbi:ACP S-malonyltransferase [Psychrobacter sp. I-STPA10]|uniref:ACP S-malonyltransferase n=1 Tax=Psychrobacter sp. I-STPA10 TaxID=2585769 RepID=UPI001E3B7000|nr:ACP S-malonyltransferase [Psychrobacter sp. I-STPA10]